MKKSQLFLGCLVCAMFIAAIAALFMIEPAMGAREPLLILIGCLSTSFGSVINYFFGSSAGSARKDELLAQSQPVEPQ